LPFSKAYLQPLLKGQESTKKFDDLVSDTSQTLSPLDAFFRGSVITPSKNKKDQIRYKACEDFKL